VPEEIEIDTDKLREAIAEEGKHESGEHESGKLLRTIALSTALFAALAAITSLQAGSTVNEALVLKSEAGVLQARASDAWAFYQTKGLKAEMAHTAQVIWAAQGKQAPADLAQTQAHYLGEQRDIAAQAKELEKERDAKSEEADRLLHHHHLFAESVALLQVAIALGAVAALTRRRPAWWASLVLGAVGTVLFGYAWISAL
jgi:hypothetical protein